MKITAVRPLVLGTPWRNLTFVVVETDEGVHGVGEVRMVNHTDALLGYLQEAAKHHILGSDPFKIEDLVQRMFRRDFARPSEIMMSAIAVVEMACWDIMGKVLNVPVYQLLGGAVRERIPAYANGWYTVERSPEEFATAAKKVTARGYRALKVDPFGAGFYELERKEQQRAVALIEAVRTAVGPEIDILIEMHGRFNASTAIMMMNKLAQFSPGWFEEPVPPENLAVLKQVSEATRSLGVPLATGERLHTAYEFRELFELQAADIIQADITHSGGILATKKLAAWADAYYMLIAPHNVCGPVGTAAALHLAACTTNFKIQEHFNDFADAWVKDVVKGLPEVDPADGCFPLPNGPGLGIELNEDFIAEHPRADVFFDLFAQDWQYRQVAKPKN
ncbi:mandelate racemase/muconate lactonizing enzyme family protein [Ktedonosporobacter rubrisoli]|uniref:Mandelate racemase/muconate lactonizing enzyme family protein n=1 Tax=Ktedonosporobacter rubrisoli TaxID=2509675 RepID=A0A4P6K5W2_KTERU|nr:mandelate racemase/muconate lactonizing enzyme family protein [Ktedonosporobacter rubrisoli]QBD83280.1 mandelate racemase/muconate lactonizing enzyme family protein [Ktedonosporobacter rubrisoli]